MRFIVCLLALASPGWALDTVRVVQSGRPFTAFTQIPIMDRGYLFFITHNSPELDAYTPDGRLYFATVIQGPDGAVPQITDAAIDDRGNVAVSFVYGSIQTLFQGGLAFLDASGKQTATLSTGRYQTSHLCFSSGGSLWTRGWQRSVTANRSDSEDYFIIRRYDTQGRQTGGFVKRSSFPPGLSPGGAWGGRWGIRASGDRIGALMMSGQNSQRLVWLELDTSGKELGRWTLPPGHTSGMAFTRDAVYAVNTTSDRDHRTSVWELDTLDKATSTWKPVSKVEYSWDHPCDCGILMTADGDDLIFAKTGGSTLEWIRP